MNSQWNRHNDTCFVVICELNSVSLDLLDQKHFSNEQIDFLDKFFKDNPWADHAQIESIAKQTGLAESIIKVGRYFSYTFFYNKSYF